MHYDKFSVIIIKPMINLLFQYLSRNQAVAAIVIIAIGWLVIELKGVFAGILISYIIMAALFPWVSFLRQKGIPNAISVSITYFVTLAFLVLLIFPLVPFFASQIQSLLNSFPRYIDDSARLLGFAIDTDQVKSLIVSVLDEIGKNALSVTGTVFSGFFFALTVLVISFYLLIDHDHIKNSIVGLFAKQSQKKTFSILTQIEEKLGAWLRGQIILSLSIGSITFLVLTLLGLEFALPLALIAGILEIVPTVGPIIAAVPAVIVALSVSPTLAVAIIALYIIIQVLENNLLVPRIMQKAVGLDPLVIIIGVIVGSKLMGVGGALLSIPFMALIVVIYKNLERQDA